METEWKCPHCGKPIGTINMLPQPISVTHVVPPTTMATPFQAWNPPVTTSTQTK